MADTPPCPMRAQNHPHDAHDWNAGEGRCPGYGEPEEFAPEPAPPQTLAGQVRDLGRIVERVREAVGTDQPAVDPGGREVEALRSEIEGLRERIGWMRTDLREAFGLDNDEAIDVVGLARQLLADARNWARHGYEIGQRHCGWSDHGVAPAWLTEGWPRSFDSCEHTKRAAEYDTALTRVRGLSDRPEAMDPNRPYSGDYLLGYRMAISTAKSVASNERAVVKHVEEDAICGVCGGGPVVYRNYKEQAFCQTCANCGCDQDPCVRTGINAPMESVPFKGMGPEVPPGPTPGCTCGLLGKSFGWHAKGCAWRQRVVAEHRGERDGETP